jgi:hypothetical protein
VEHFTELKKLALAKLNYIITDDEKYITEKENIEKRLYGKSVDFDHGSEKNYITIMKMSQEKLSVQMQVSGINNPEDMTVMQFYVAIDYLNERSKQMTHGKKTYRP